MPFHWCMHIQRCWRSLANLTLPNQDRGELGSGKLQIFKHNNTGRFLARFFDASDTKLMEALVPKSEVAFKEVQGNNGTEPAFFWECSNMCHSAGGTVVKGANDPKKSTAIRRFSFVLNTRAELTVGLSFLFNHDMAVLNEFFEVQGRFTHLENTLPPHEVVLPDNMMDIDSIPQRKPATDERELEEAYGNDPLAASQLPF